MLVVWRFAATPIFSARTREKKEKKKKKKAGAGGGREFVPRRSETRNGIAKH